MKNFAAVYKKRFREILSPYGYKTSGATFYRLEDEVFFSILVSRYTKGTHPQMGVYPGLNVFVGMHVYERSLAGHYDAKNWGGGLWEILRRTTSDKMSIEELSRHYSKLTDARDEESTISSLELLGDVFENLVLPYIHKFTDLEFFYAEEIALCTTLLQPISTIFTDEMSKAYHNPYSFPSPIARYPTVEEVIKRNPTIYHLSMKLRKYDCAIIHIDEGLLGLNNRLKAAESELALLRSGGLTDVLLAIQNYSPKDLPGIVDQRMFSAENAIKEWQYEIKQLQTIKSALLTNDDAFIDDYILKIEKTSREYVKQVFANKKQDR